MSEMDTAETGSNWHCAQTQCDPKFCLNDQHCIDASVTCIDFNDHEIALICASSENEACAELLCKAVTECCVMLGMASIALTVPQGGTR